MQNSMQKKNSLSDFASKSYYDLRVWMRCCKTFYHRVSVVYEAVENKNSMEVLNMLVSALANEIKEEYEVISYVFDEKNYERLQKYGLVFQGGITKENTKDSTTDSTKDITIKISGCEIETFSQLFALKDCYKIFYREINEILEAIRNKEPDGSLRERIISLKNDVDEKLEIVAYEYDMCITELSRLGLIYDESEKSTGKESDNYAE